MDQSDSIRVQRAATHVRRGSATAPFRAQPQTEGTFRISARFEGKGVPWFNPKGPTIPRHRPPAHLAYVYNSVAGQRESREVAWIITRWRGARWGRCLPYMAVMPERKTTQGKPLSLLMRPRGFRGGD